MLSAERSSTIVLWLLAILWYLVTYKKDLERSPPDEDEDQKKR